MRIWATNRVKKKLKDIIKVNIEGKKHIDGIPEDSEKTYSLTDDAFPEFLKSKGRSMLMQGKSGQGVSCLMTFME